MRVGQKKYPATVAHDGSFLWGCMQWRRITLAWPTIYWRNIIVPPHSCNIKAFQIKKITNGKQNQFSKLIESKMIPLDFAACSLYIEKDAISLSLGTFIKLGLLSEHRDLAGRWRCRKCKCSPWISVIRGNWPISAWRRLLCVHP